MGHVRVTGVVARLGWLLIDTLLLIGCRNRIMAMLEWAWGYLTWQRGARLITGAVGPKLDPPGVPLGGEMPDGRRADLQTGAAEA